MVARAEAMSSAHTSDPKPLAGRPLLRRVASVFLSGVVAAFFFALLYPLSEALAPPVLAVVSAAGMGLVCGFTARLALRRSRRLLREAAALAALALGLVALGAITSGLAGIDPLRLSSPRPQWAGLAQVILGSATTWLALHAWGPSAARAPLRRASPTAPAVPPPAPRPSRPPRPRSTDRRAAARPLRLRRAQPAHPARKLRRRVRVRLVGAEEHRCPYCLELVVKKDPRGVVTCRVCHTRHHADCWALAGDCQVPHHHP